MGIKGKGRCVSEGELEVYGVRRRCCRAKGVFEGEVLGACMG